MDVVARSVGRAIWVAHEHEAMHLETLLYMMLQSDHIAPPKGINLPDWEMLAKDARLHRVENP